MYSYNYIYLNFNSIYHFIDYFRVQLFSFVMHVTEKIVRYFHTKSLKLIYLYANMQLNIIDFISKY